jgi:hypothetical protein
MFIVPFQGLIRLMVPNTGLRPVLFLVAPSGLFTAAVNSTESELTNNEGTSFSGRLRKICLWKEMADYFEELNFPGQ